MDQQEQKVDKWKTVYNAVRGALDFRVANLNSQQQRIANVLFANGLIFGFLGASAGVFFDAKVPKWCSANLHSFRRTTSLSCLDRPALCDLSFPCA